jgi:hypothetical protein
MTGKTCSKLDGCPLPADHDGFCQAPESWRRADKPGKTHAAELAELALTLHRAVAFSDDPAISAGDSPVYVATRATLRVLILTAYPELDADRIYEVADESGESIAYAARWLVDDARATAEQQAREMAEELEYRSARTRPPAGDGGWVSGGMWSGSTLDDELARGDI